jgi:hypothetical protein
MRRFGYVGALVTMAALFAVPVSAQTSDASPQRGAWHVNAVLGRSFDSVGVGPAGVTSAGYDFGQGLSVVGELGTFKIKPAIPLGVTYDVDRVNSYHANANVRYSLPNVGWFGSYVTTGFGTFNTSTIIDGPASATAPAFDRDTHPAANVGFGFNLRLTPWLGFGGDQRSFFLNGSPQDVRRVHRFTLGVTLMAG